MHDWLARPNLWHCKVHRRREWRCSDMRWTCFLHNLRLKIKAKPLLLFKSQSSTKQKPTQPIQHKEAQLTEYPSYPHNTFSCSFVVLLTVHLSIILVINQLNAQNPLLYEVYYTPLHVSITMCSSSGGQNFIIQNVVSSQLLVAVPYTDWGKILLSTCARDGHL